MITFEYEQFNTDDRPIVLRSLATPADDIPDVVEVIEINGARIPIPEELGSRLGGALIHSFELDEQGHGNDCTVFAVEAMGGDYNPISSEEYWRGLAAKITFGIIFQSPGAVLLEPTAEPSLMHFLNLDQANMTLSPAHTAVKVPGHDLVIQKMGFESPIIATSVGETMELYRSNLAASVDQWASHYRGEEVLHYANTINPKESPAYVMALEHREDN